MHAIFLVKYTFIVIVRGQVVFEVFGRGTQNLVFCSCVMLHVTLLSLSLSLSLSFSFLHRKQRG
jgi:hypothetical protein